MKTETLEVNALRDEFEVEYIMNHQLPLTKDARDKIFIEWLCVKLNGYRKLQNSLKTEEERRYKQNSENW